MTKTELARLACAISVHRPDWPEASLRTFLERNLAHRPYLDVSVALTWVATDPDSQSPARVLEAGPWWAHSRTADIPRNVNTCPDHTHAGIRTDARTGQQTCAGCWADSHGTDGQPQPLRRRGVPPAPETRQQLLAALTPSRPATSSAATDGPETGR